MTCNENATSESSDCIRRNVPQDGVMTFVIISLIKTSGIRLWVARLWDSRFESTINTHRMCFLKMGTCIGIKGVFLSEEFFGPGVTSMKSEIFEREIGWLPDTRFRRENRQLFTLRPWPECNSDTGWWCHTVIVCMNWEQYLNCEAHVKVTGCFLVFQFVMCVYHPKWCQGNRNDVTHHITSHIAAKRLRWQFWQRSALSSG